MQRRRRRTALCLADLHSHVTALERLDGLLGALAGELDVVLVAGDVTVPGKEAYARRLIDLVARRRVPLLLVHGNNDSWPAVQEFRRAGVTIHRQEREWPGSASPASVAPETPPTTWSWGQGRRCTSTRRGASSSPTSRPPAGSRTARTPPAPAPPSAATPHLLAPRAQVCGHIHHSEGVAWIGPTKVIKLRAAM